MQLLRSPRSNQNLLRFKHVRLQKGAVCQYRCQSTAVGASSLYFATATSNRLVSSEPVGDAFHTAMAAFSGHEDMPDVPEPNFCLCHATVDHEDMAGASAIPYSAMQQ